MIVSRDGRRDLKANSELVLPPRVRIRLGVENGGVPRFVRSVHIISFFVRQPLVVTIGGRA